MHRSIFTLCVTLFLITQVVAQEDADKRWKFLVAGDLYAPLVGGNVTINGNESTLKEEVQLSSMFAAEAVKRRWSIYTDVLFTNVSVPVTTPVANRNGTYQGDYTFWTLFATWKWTKWLNVGLGTRIVFANSELFLEQGILLPEVNTSQKTTIFNPVVALRFDVLDTDRWRLVVRGDVGGFGIQSTFTYLFNPILEYRLVGGFGPFLAYRLLSTYRNDQEGEDKIDVVLNGPQVGLFVRF